VEALLALARELPRDLPAAVLVTLHIASDRESVLADVIDRAGPLRARFARDGEKVKSGHVYIAPPDRHLLLDGDTLRHGLGSRENNARPAIDPMFRSVAACCGARGIGVVLTGTLYDGASGLWAMEQCGGTTVVQDPEDAAFPEMPLNAINRIKPDYIVSLAQMPGLLSRLVQEPAAATRSPVPESVRFEVELAKGAQAHIEDMDRIGRRSAFACPDCHGALWEMNEGELMRFRCHVGHTYGAEVLSMSMDENLRRALGSALRALEERRTLAQRLEHQARQSNHRHLAASWGSKAREYERELETIRSSVERLENLKAESIGSRAAE